MPLPGTRLGLMTFVSRLELGFKLSDSRRPSSRAEARFGPLTQESLDTPPTSTQTESPRSVIRQAARGKESSDPQNI